MARRMTNGGDWRRAQGIGGIGPAYAPRPLPAAVPVAIPASKGVFSV